MTGRTREHRGLSTIHFWNGACTCFCPSCRAPEGHCICPGCQKHATPENAESYAECEPLCIRAEHTADCLRHRQSADSGDAA